MNEFYSGMAEMFEVDKMTISPEFRLDSAEATWDSLAIVSTIALVDDCFQVLLDGRALSECKTIADVLALIEASQKQQ